MEIILVQNIYSRYVTDCQVLILNCVRPDGTILFDAYKIPAANSAGILEALESIVSSVLKGLKKIFTGSYKILIK